MSESVVDINRDKSLDRIRRVSRLMIYASTLGTALLITAFMALWINPTWFEAILAAQNLGATHNAPLTLEIKLALFAVTCMPFGLLIWGLWQVRALFTLFSSGEIFSFHVTQRLKRVGLALLIGPFLGILARSIASVLVSINNPPGQKALSISLSSNDYLFVMIGGLVMVIAWVMGEATQLADDHKQIV